MVKLKAVVLGFCMLAAGLVAFMIFFQSDEAKIKKQFKALASTLSLDAGESKFEAGAKARKIAMMLADPCVVNIPTYDITRTISRSDAQTYIMASRSAYSSLSVDFHDISIIFPEKGRLAEVTATVYVKTAAKGGGPLEKNVSEVRFELKAVEDSWLFAGINEVVVLEK
jgi:hypothetical protein